MKVNKMLLGGLCAAAVASLSAGTAFAQGGLAPKTVDFLASTQISGSVVTSYGYDVQGGSSIGDGALGGTFAGAGIGPRSNAFSLNQFNLILEKPLDEGDWEAGYRVDIAGGQDAAWVAAGLGSANLTLAQGYVAMRTPIGPGVVWKLGKMYSPFGNEVYVSPSNFNITRSLIYIFAQPTTLTGFQGSTTFNLADGVTLDLLAGISNGWDSVTEINSGKSYYGQAVVGFWEGKASVAVGGIIGNEFAGDNQDYRGLVDIVATIKPTEQLTISLNGDWGQQSFNDSNGGPHNAFWGASGIVAFKVNDMVDLAVRGEFFSDDVEGTNLALGPPFNTRTGFPGGQDIYSVTGTVGLNVWKNVVTRAEVRWTKSSEDSFPQNEGDGIKNNLLFAVEAAYLF